MQPCISIAANAIRYIFTVRVRNISMLMAKIDAVSRCSMCAPAFSLALVFRSVCFLFRKFLCVFFFRSLLFRIGVFFCFSVSTLSRYTKLQRLFSAHDGSAAGQTDIIECHAKHILTAHNRSVQSIISTVFYDFECCVRADFLFYEAKMQFFISSIIFR